MARSHGRFSRFLVGVTAGSEASQLSHTGSWGGDFSADRVEVTAEGDTQKTYLAGYADGSFDLDGFCTDTPATSLILAALDGLPRKFYAYQFASTSIYMAGTAYFDCKVSNPVDGAVTFTGTAQMASPLILVGYS